MNKVKPYISLDLETTGLDREKSQILQIAAVYDDGQKPLEDLPRLNLVINEPITYAQIGALVLHEKTRLFSRIQEAVYKKEAYSLEKGLDTLLDFIEKWQPTKESSSPDVKEPTKLRIALAGKNIGTFDLVLLKRWMTKDQRKRFFKAIAISVIDAGGLYFVDYGYIPSLNEILKQLKSEGKIERDDVIHDALEDALDVIRCIRHKCNKVEDVSK